MSENFLANPNFPKGLVEKPGVCADLIRSIDWDNHPMGPAKLWPAPLKVALNILVHSQHPMFIWWGSNLFQFYNDAYLPSFGDGKHPKAMGQRGEECWPEIWPIISPQIDLVMNEAGSTWNEEQFIPIYRNGRLEDVYWTYGYSPILLEDGSVGGTLVVCTEITKQVEARKAEAISGAKIKESRDEVMRVSETSRLQLHEFFMRSPLPMVIMEGPEHRFVLSNPVYEKLIGLDPFGKTIEQVFRPEEVENYLPYLNQVYETGVPFLGTEMPFKRVSEDGTVHESFVTFGYHPYRDAERKIKGIFAIIEDVTESVVAKQGLESNRIKIEGSNTELRASKIEAERVTDLKSAFLANMSHEIRTPLGVILGFAEILKNSETTSDERNEYLGIITRNGHALTRIIDDILDLSKIEADKLEIENSALCLSDLCRDVIAMFFDRATGKGISLNFDSEKFPKVKINSDPIRIRQILINLIGNGIKFTSEGSVKVHGDYTAMSDGSFKVSILVTDTGIGLTPAQAKNLFTPFTQGDNRSTRRFGGTGLGLTLSRRLAQALGGDVTIEECEELRGCTFKLEMIAKPITNKASNKNQSITKTYLNKERLLDGVKVLVVDDAQDNRTLIDIFLKREGAIVDMASDGEEGVRMALSNSYDAILMDIQMPGIDGYEALSKLRSKNYRKPVLALTAHAMKEERNRALAAGFSDHISKPINPTDLIESLFIHTRSTVH